MSSLLAIALVLAQAAFAPVAQDMFSIRGTVTDPSKALIPGVRVEVRSDPTKPPEYVVTDESGVYVLNQLPAGVYEVAANLPGFERDARVLDLKASAVVDFVLRVPNVETCACISVGVQPAAPLPFPQDSLRRTRSEQATLRLWKHSLQTEDGANPQEMESQWQSIITDFRTLGVDGLPALTRLLKDANPRVRETTVLVLGTLGPDARQALPHLSEFVDRNTTLFEQSVNRAIASINGR